MFGDFFGFGEQFFGLVLAVHKAARSDIHAVDFAGKRVHADYRDDHAFFGKVFAISEYHASDVAHTQAVDKQAARRHVVADTYGVFSDFYHVADIGNDDIRRRRTHFYGEFGVLLQVSALAVYRNKEFRLDQRVHQFDFVLTSVTRSVDLGEAFVNDFRSSSV